MEGEDTTVNGDVGFDAAMGLGSKAKLPELNEADAEEERETDEREQRWKSVRGKFLGSIEFASRLWTNCSINQPTLLYFSHYIQFYVCVYTNYICIQRERKREREREREWW